MNDRQCSLAAERRRMLQSTHSGEPHRHPDHAGSRRSEAARGAPAGPHQGTPARRGGLLGAIRRRWGGTAPVAVRRLLAVVLAACALASGAARADVLVTNLDQLATNSPINVNRDTPLAQGFRTGADSVGYTLSSVEVALFTIPASEIGDLSVSVWTADGAGHPETMVAELTNPAEFTVLSDCIGGTNYCEFAGDPAVFSAPEPLTLDASTDYLVRLEYDQPDTESMWSTNSDSEISTEGWSIADAVLIGSEGGAWTAHSGGQALLLRINGTAGTAGDPVESARTAPDGAVVRFGRMVGSQVVDALAQRLEGGVGPHVTVGGIDLAGAPGSVPAPGDHDPFGLPAWAMEAEREADARTVGAGDLLRASAFHLSDGEAEAGAGPAVSAWGRVATGRFEAEEEGVVIDGDVTSAILGLDARWERALAGVMLTQSEGDVSLGGEVLESSLKGVYPYASLDLNARMSAWVLAGGASGELTPSGVEGATPADTKMRLRAVGLRGRLLDGTGPSGLVLNVRSDAMWVRTESDGTDELGPTDGSATRQRLVVQGERVVEGAGGGTLTPSAEVGLRNDGGDAETGSALEAAAGVRYSAGPLTVEGRVHMLVAHEASGYEEHGASGAVRVTPSASGRGLSLSIVPAWGRTGSDAERLWSARDAGALGAGEGADRLDMEAGYGLGLAEGRGVLTPYAGLTVGDEAGRGVRTGARWRLGPDTVLGLEAVRRGDGAGEAGNEVRLRAVLRF